MEKNENMIDAKGRQNVQGKSALGQKTPKLEINKI